ncbi:hypothetical protein LSAT2_004355 [Lamellibrachia satsuma]|nr:hypothetical protein LSAT2_004355 [Lamellibrachia satsuma]
MKSEEEQYISTWNQLLCSDAAPEDARCTPADVSQKRVSSNSQSPTGSPTCGCVASVSLVKQSCDDYQVLQGLRSIKSEEHPAEIHSQEGFLLFEKTCHQKDRLPAEYSKPHIQVNSEKVESDDCKSNSGAIRKLRAVVPPFVAHIFVWVQSVLFVVTYVFVQNLGAYIISVKRKTPLCTQAMCATNGGATARSLDNRGYLGCPFQPGLIKLSVENPSPRNYTTCCTGGHSKGCVFPDHGDSSEVTYP